MAGQGLEDMEAQCGIVFSIVPLYDWGMAMTQKAWSFERSNSRLGGELQ